MKNKTQTTPTPAIEEFKKIFTVECPLGGYDLRGNCGGGYSAIQFLEEKLQASRKEVLEDVAEQMGEPDIEDEHTVPFVAGKIVVLRQLHDVLQALGTEQPAEEQEEGK